MEAAACQFGRSVEQLLQDAKEESVGSMLKALGSMLAEREQVLPHPLWPVHRDAESSWVGGLVRSWESGPGCKWWRLWPTLSTAEPSTRSAGIL